MAGQVGGFVQAARLRAGLTQTQLAAVSGVKRDYVASVEAGRIELISPDFFQKLKSVLGFAGWGLLEAMGYETDVAEDGQSRRLLAAVGRLRPDQRASLLTFLESMDGRKEI